MFEKLLPSFGPKIGLKTLCKLIPERVGHPVEKFELRFFAKELRIDFLIFLPDSFNMYEPYSADLVKKYSVPSRSHLYKFDGGEKISRLIMAFITPKLDKNFVLEIAIINYDEKTDIAEVSAYGLKDGQKEKQTFTI